MSLDSLCCSDDGSTIDQTRNSNVPIVRLTVSLEDGSIFEWFEVTDESIESVTLDLFSTKVDEFFGIPVDLQEYVDVDGRISTTSDLRRSLRANYPMISIKQLPCPQDPPLPAPLPSVRIVLRREGFSDFFGFSNVVSRSGDSLTISRIDPSGLLARSDPGVKVGDQLLSVNGELDMEEMRRELIVSSMIIMDIRLASFQLVV